jgi:hypothetical protein
MALLNDLLDTLPDADIHQVLVGLHWTAVVAELGDERYCGLATTLVADHDHHSKPDVLRAGHLETLSGAARVSLAKSNSPTIRGIGVAAINALLPPLNGALLEENAAGVIAKHGDGKKVVLVGRFPFTSWLWPGVRELIVLERCPHPEELPETAAKDIFPKADVVAIIGMTSIHHTQESLLVLCSPQAVDILLGPSTLLSPILFDYGVELLCGSVVTAIDPVLRAVGQRANFRQVPRAGVRLVSITRPGVNLVNAKKDKHHDRKS